MGFCVEYKRIILYQVITGSYDKVVNLKALIPFFGMGSSFITLSRTCGSEKRREKNLWKERTITESDWTSELLP